MGKKKMIVKANINSEGHDVGQCVNDSTRMHGTDNVDGRELEEGHKHTLQSHRESEDTARRQFRNGVIPDHPCEDESQRDTLNIPRTPIDQDLRNFRHCPADYARDTQKERDNVLVVADTIQKV